MTTVYGDGPTFGWDADWATALWLATYYARLEGVRYHVTRMAREWAWGPVSR